MSEITLRKFGHPIGPANGYNTIPANTPIYMYAEGQGADADSVNLSNIQYLKSALGFSEEERKISQIIEWMTSNGKNVDYMNLKKNELTSTNKKLCKFILEYLNLILWKTPPTGGFLAAANEQALMAGQMTTYDVHEAINSLIPAFKGVAAVMAAMLEYKYPSNLVGASLSNAIKQVNLEVKEKTEDIVQNKNIKKPRIKKQK